MEELLTQPNHYTAVYNSKLKEDSKIIENIIKELGIVFVQNISPSNVLTLVINTDTFNNCLVRRYNFRLSDLSEVEIIIREMLNKENIND